METQVERVILSTITERGLDIASTSFSLDENQKNKIFQVSKNFGDIDESFEKAYQYYSVPGGYISISRITNAGKDIVGRTRNKHFVCLLLKKQDILKSSINPFVLLNDDGLFLSDKEIRVLINRDIKSISSINIGLDKYEVAFPALPDGCNELQASYILDLIFQKKNIVFMLSNQKQFEDTLIPFLFDFLPNQYREVTSISTFSYSGKGNFKILATSDEIYRKHHQKFSSHVLIDLSEENQTFPTAGLFSTFLIHNALEGDKEATSQIVKQVNELSVDRFLSVEDLNSTAQYFQSCSILTSDSNDHDATSAIATILTTVQKNEILIPLLHNNQVLLNLTSALLLRRYCRDMFGEPHLEPWEKAFLKLTESPNHNLTEIFNIAVEQAIDLCESNFEQIMVLFNNMFTRFSLEGKEHLITFFNKCLLERHAPYDIIIEFYLAVIGDTRKFPNREIAEHIYSKLEQVVIESGDKEYFGQLIIEAFRMHKARKAFHLLHEWIVDKNEQLEILEKAVEYPEVKGNSDIRGAINNYRFDRLIEESEFEKASAVFNDLGGLGLIAYLIPPRLSSTNAHLKKQFLMFLALYPGFVGIPQNDYSLFLKNISRQDIQTGDYISLVENVCVHSPQYILPIIEFFTGYLSKRGGWIKYKDLLKTIDEKIVYQGNALVVRVWDDFKKLTARPAPRVYPASQVSQPRHDIYIAETKPSKEEVASSDYLYLLIIFFCVFIGGWFLIENVVDYFFPIDAEILEVELILEGFEVKDTLSFITDENNDEIIVEIESNPQTISLKPNDYKVIYNPIDREKGEMYEGSRIIVDDVNNSISKDNFIVMQDPEPQLGEKKDPEKEKEKTSEFHNELASRCNDIIERIKKNSKEISQEGIVNQFNGIDKILKKHKYKNEDLRTYLVDLKKLWLAYNTSLKENKYKPLIKASPFFEKVSKPPDNIKTVIGDKLNETLTREIQEFLQKKLEEECKALPVKLEYSSLLSDIEALHCYKIDDIETIKEKVTRSLEKARYLFNRTIVIRPSVIEFIPAIGTKNEVISPLPCGGASVEIELDSGKLNFLCNFHSSPQKWNDENAFKFLSLPDEENKKKLNVSLNMDVYEVEIDNEENGEKYIAWLRIGSTALDSKKGNVIFYDHINCPVIKLDEKEKLNITDISPYIGQNFDSYEIATKQPVILFENNVIKVTYSFIEFQSINQDELTPIKEGKYITSQNKYLKSISFNLIIERLDL